MLITKDQAWNVARLIESVLRETAPLGSAEVVLVDSASSDETTAVAARYPIDVLRLDAGQVLTPAAGRYVGYRQTSAELVLFLDGDMELCPRWLAPAMQLLGEQDDVAVVTGPLIERLPGAAGGRDVPRVSASGQVRDVRYSAGAALHRRSVLERVGTFNPYLHSDEEPELCIRIRQAGHRVAELDRPLAYHYSADSRALSTLAARRRRRLYLGAGQAIRYHLRDGLLWPYVRQRGYGLVPAGVLLAGFALLLLSARSGSRAPFRAWLLATTAAIAADTARKRSLRATLYSLVLRLCIVEGTLRGLLAAPQPPAGYRARYEVVRRRSRLS